MPFFSIRRGVSASAVAITCYRFKFQIAKFNIVANDTQAMYGTSNHAASFEIFEKDIMVRIIIITIKIISSNANAGELILKKIILHQKFKKSCSPNKK
jgi:hypothetical protein